ncbi:MAG: hypothetical protein Q9166_001223 [cf. Caloplaca sp. 2 TL-2023]
MLSGYNSPPTENQNPSNSAYFRPSSGQGLHDTCPSTDLLQINPHYHFATPPYPVSPHQETFHHHQLPNDSPVQSDIRYHHHTVPSGPSRNPNNKTTANTPPSPSPSIQTIIYSPISDNEPCTRLQPVLSKLISIELKIHGFPNHTYDHILSSCKQCIHTCASLARREPQCNDTTKKPQNKSNNGNSICVESGQEAESESCCTCCLRQSPPEAFSVLLAILTQRIADLLEKLHEAITSSHESQSQELGAQKLPMEIGCDDKFHLENWDEVRFVVGKLLVLELKNLEALVGDLGKRAEIHGWPENIGVLEDVGKRSLEMRTSLMNDDCG